MKRAMKWIFSIGFLLTLLYAPMAVMATLRVGGMVEEQLGAGSRFSGVVLPFLQNALLVRPHAENADGSFQFSADALLAIGPIDAEDADHVGWSGTAWDVLVLSGTDTLTARRLMVTSLDVAGIFVAQEGQVALPGRLFGSLRGEDMRLSSRGDVVRLHAALLRLGDGEEISQARLSDGQVQKISGERLEFSELEFSGLGWPTLARMLGWALPPSLQDRLRGISAHQFVLQGTHGEMFSCADCAAALQEDGRSLDATMEGLVFRPDPDNVLHTWVPDGLEGNLELSLVHDLDARVLCIENLHAEIPGMTVEGTGRFGNIPDLQNDNIRLLEPGAVTLINLSLSLQDHGFLKGILEHRAGVLGVSMDRQAEALLKDALGPEVWRDTKNRGRAIVEREIRPFLEDPDTFSAVFAPAKPLPAIGLAAALFIQPALVVPLLERGDLAVSRKMR